MRDLIDIINAREGKIVTEPISIISDLSGIFLFMAIFFLIIFLSRSNKNLFLILFLAFTIRSLTALTNYYIFPFPDSLWDSRAVEFFALLYSNVNITTWIDTFGFSNHSSIFHFILSFFYYFFGRSPLILLGFSVFLGIMSIYIFYNTCFEIFTNRNVAFKSSLLLAFLPAHVLYSSLIMKEIVIVFIIISSIYFYVKWFKYNTHLSALLSFIIYSSLLFFHSGLLVGIVPFVTAYLYRIFVQNIFLLQYLKFSYPGILFLSFYLLIFIVLFLILPLDLVHNSHYFSINFFENLLIHSKNTFVGAASFPDFILPSNVKELFLFFIPKVAYFLYSPFIWDISKISHLLGFIDGTILLIFSYLILLNFNVIFKNKILLIIFISLLLMIATYTLGTGNFGTAIRHRFKFIFLFLILTANQIPNFVIKHKNKSLKIFPLRNND